MPNAEDKSVKQKAAEADVDRFRKNLGPFVVAVVRRIFLASSNRSGRSSGQ
jgi:hypothetical protein